MQSSEFDKLFCCKLDMSRTCPSLAWLHLSYLGKAGVHAFVMACSPCVQAVCCFGLCVLLLLYLRRACACEMLCSRPQSGLCQPTSLSSRSLNCQSVAQVPT